MGLEEVLCMNGGMGETSYANNSSMQRSFIREMRSTLEESIRAICGTISPECLSIADLGCSSGPNSLDVLQSIIEVVVSTCRDSGLPIPEFNLFMNDLPHNDFNTIFKSLLPGFYKKIEEEKDAEIACFISATPGSFYGRLFPSESIHFMHSSTSLHWLSQGRDLRVEVKFPGRHHSGFFNFDIPSLAVKAPERFVGEGGKEVINKGSVYATKSSAPEVMRAYKQQFERDFTLFLRCRSEEIVNGGGISLCFTVTHDNEASLYLEITSKALYKLAYEGLIDKEKLDAFNLPFYSPTVQQVKQLIEAEGSFIIHKHNTFVVPWGDAFRSTKAENDTDQVDVKTAKFITNVLRAAYEPTIAREFGGELMDTLFCVVEDMVMKELGAIAEDSSPLNLALSLIRKI